MKFLEPLIVVPRALMSCFQFMVVLPYGIMMSGQYAIAGTAIGFAVGCGLGSFITWLVLR